MMQLKKLCPIAVALLTLGLSGCGSDSDTVVSPPGGEDTSTPSNEERNPAWEFVEVPYFELKDTKLKGDVHVKLGRRINSTELWIFNGLMNAYLHGDMSADVNGDGLVNHYDSTEAGFSDEEIGPVFDVNTNDMIAYLATNPDGLGAGTSRPDIFVEGQYSAFDLLRYVVGTRDDLQFEGEITSYKDSEYDTYEFNLSWDANGDGLFNEKDGEHYNSSLWHFATSFSNGGIPSQYYNIPGTGQMYTWKRMDRYWLREDQSIRFLAHSEEMTNRRHWIWKQEQDRLAKNEGKFIIPQVTVQGTSMNSPGDISGEPLVIAENLEVIPFNLRSDVFQPGVITAMDIWLTLAKYHGQDFRLTWWPVTTEGAKVNNFALSATPWTGEFTRFGGVTPDWGEVAAKDQLFRGVPPQCNFKKDGSQTAPGEGEVDQATCFKEFATGNAGNSLTEPFASNVLAYPPEYFNLVTHNITVHQQDLLDLDLRNDPKIEVYVAKDELQHTHLNGDGDFDLYPTEDVTGVASLVFFPAADKDNKVGNAPILDETHFGWKIPDCTQCHNDEKDPLGHGGESWPTNSADGFNFAQPYYCASCHGSNGAPTGHDRRAGCFWCHNTNNDDLLPKNHGDVSRPKFIPAEKLVANHRKSRSWPIKADGTIKFFDDMWYPSPNSDYTLSRTFPDPYACGTCHPADKTKNRR